MATILRLRRRPVNMLCFALYSIYLCASHRKRKKRWWEEIARETTRISYLGESYSGQFGWSRVSLLHCDIYIYIHRKCDHHVLLLSDTIWKGRLIFLETFTSKSTSGNWCWILLLMENLFSPTLSRKWQFWRSTILFKELKNRNAKVSNLEPVSTYLNPKQNSFVTL